MSIITQIRVETYILYSKMNFKFVSKYKNPYK